ncbi:DUF4124 domain-containing protein [Vibrio sp. C8]
MKNALLLFFLLCVSNSTTSKEIYIWLDDKGVQHFSDTPEPSAKPLAISSFETSNSGLAETKARKSQRIEEALTPLSISILSPSDGETIRSNEGNISITIGLNRQLTDPERLQLLMNGQPIGAPSTRTVWPLKNIERGSHRFLIQAVGSGKVIASSSVVTVYLHRASVN